MFATHRFALDDAMTAYDTFADAASTGALKVVLEADQPAGGSEVLVAALSAE